jgi:ribosomal small subunit protein bTHX
MGKGDKKSRRGKIWSGSYGKSRNKKTNKASKPSDNKGSNS